VAQENPEIEKLLRQGLKQIDIVIDGHCVRRLTRYCEELRKWNRKINLVARNTSLQDLVEKHFLDSLTLLPALQELNYGDGPLLDVGSGAGFPGLVLKIACPDLRILLLEPRQRRAVFLRHIIRILGLEGIEVSTKRIEDEGAVSGYHFALITGRAVADVSRFLKMVDPGIVADTFVLCMQGPSEKQRWEKGTRAGAMRCVKILETVLPFSRSQRCVLIFQRT